MNNSKTLRRVLSVFLAMLIACSTFVFASARDTVPPLAKGEDAHNFEQTVYPPTCTAEGYTINYCLNCNQIYKSDIEEKLGHDMVKAPDLPATCTSNGYINAFNCSRCDFKTREAVMAFGHTDKDGDKICETCGSAIYKLDCKCICHKGNFFSIIVRFFATMFTNMMGKDVKCCSDMEFYPA